jgi:hypothetical protein
MAGGSNRKASLRWEWASLIIGLCILLFFLFMLFEYGPGVLLESTPKGRGLSATPSVFFLILAFVMTIYPLKEMWKSNNKTE